MMSGLENFRRFLGFVKGIRNIEMSHELLNGTVLMK